MLNAPQRDHICLPRYTWLGACVLPDDSLTSVPFKMLMAGHGNRSCSLSGSKVWYVVITTSPQSHKLIEKNLTELLSMHTLFECRDSVGIFRYLQVVGMVLWPTASTKVAKLPEIMRSFRKDLGFLNCIRSHTSWTAWQHGPSHYHGTPKSSECLVIGHASNQGFPPCDLYQYSVSW